MVDVEAGGGLWQAELPGQISDESFSPSDALVAVSELGGGVHVYDTATGSLTSSFSPGTGAVTSVSFLDEQRLAIATTDGVEVRDLANGGRWEQQITVRGAETVRALGPQQLSVVTTNMDELVVLDLEQSGLGRPLAAVPPGARVYVVPEGIATVAAIAAAEGDLIDLRSGETKTHALTMPNAGVVVGITPGRSADAYLAFTIDGAIGAFEDGTLVDDLYLSDEAGFTMRSATGHRTPDGGIRVAVHLSNPAGSNEVHLVDLVTLEKIFSVDGECPCVGAIPTPDGNGLILDTGDAVTVHTANGDVLALAASSIDGSSAIVEHAVDPNRDRILRSLPDGTIEEIDMAGGPSTSGLRVRRRSVGPGVHRHHPRRRGHTLR